MTYRTMWEIEVRHDGLGKYRHIRGSDKSVVEQKAAYQRLQWDMQWEKQCQKKIDDDNRALVSKQKAEERDRLIKEKETKREQSAAEKARQKQDALRYKEERTLEATTRDSDAKDEIERLRNILSYTITVNDAIDWEQYKDKSLYKEPTPALNISAMPNLKPLPSEPTREPTPEKPRPLNRPIAPDIDASKYRPKLGLLDNIFSSRKAERLAEARSVFQKDYSDWELECALIKDADTLELQNWEEAIKSSELKYAKQIKDWENEVDKIKSDNKEKTLWWEKKCEKERSEHSEAMQKWEKRAEKFYELQREANTVIDKNRELYLSGEQGAVTDYCDTVLANSVYPEYFDKEWDVDYKSETKTVVVEYALPPPDSLPTLNGVQYLPSKDAFRETHLSVKELETLYDSVLYQITLRTIHELFEADIAGAINAVVFSGLVSAINKTTGHIETSCILSVLATKDVFLKINLSSIDPKACFKSLRGIAASKLYGLSPVAPVMTINKDDRRFVSSYGVVEFIDESTNLATMNWEDFEHLIREVFEQEFISGGGEVKVTQASRDGGVDAIAFDPDPIRGGKIVIQAKRYTNTVGVSSVRDLYGTVMNEGATKGILVTTADYGPDAYEFAQGKPLTLLNGSNLLHLLEKHGHKARININEAKTELSQFK